MKGGKEIFEIMEKNKMIDLVGNGEFLLSKLFFGILQSNLLKYESALDAIVFSVKSYLPESPHPEITLTCTFVITIMKRDYPEIAKEALDTLVSGVDSHTLETLFDKSSFLPQSMDEVLMSIKKYEEWK